MEKIEGDKLYIIRDLDKPVDCSDNFDDAIITMLEFYGDCYSKNGVKLYNSYLPGLNIWKYAINNKEFNIRGNNRYFIQEISSGDDNIFDLSSDKGIIQYMIRQNKLVKIMSINCYCVDVDYFICCEKGDFIYDKYCEKKVGMIYENFVYNPPCVKDFEFGKYN